MRIGLIGLPDSEILDVAGPLSVFSTANACRKEMAPELGPLYSVELIATDPSRVVTCVCGVSLNAQTDFRACAGEVFDTLLVGGGFGIRRLGEIEGFLPWLAEQGSKTRRLGSICAGVAALAAAGLVNGRRVTTHWRYCAEIAAKFPKVNFDPNPIFIRDGNVITSAGVTSGIDLSLALVEEDGGPELALDVARNLVVFLRRPGSQAQFSTTLTLQASDRSALRNLQSWLIEHLHEPLTVEDLADQAGMSPRNFARVFARNVGMPPGKFLSQVRLEFARRRLEETDHSIEQIAESCGFGNTENLRSTFQKSLEVSPQEYRRRFRTLNPASGGDFSGFHISSSLQPGGSTFL
ncbi:MAG: helix-turn-helix domain-containing protein [Blastocatellia bacterium]|nr:helix-turn-helix domain-containing protein [Blastocatellia bacterium]